MLRKGRITRIHSNLFAALIWVWVLIIFVGAMFALDRQTNQPAAIGIAAAALGWLIIGAVVVIINQIRQTGLGAQEEVVRMQLQMSEIAEKLDRLQR